MRETRSIKMLLTILLNTLQKLEEDDFTGLCQIVRYKLYGKKLINSTELKKIEDYITKHRPKTRNRKYAYPFYSGYSWHTGLKQPRIAWLIKHITRNDNDK